MSDSHITKKEKLFSLNKLLTSNVFKSESAYRKILKYYLEYISKDEDVDFSETSIALDALEKDVEFNPYYDSSVRVAMHRLRNNLVNYYSLEGKSDSIKIHIPIGDYNPIFYKEDITDDSPDYYIQIMKAVVFQLEHTLSEDAINLHQYIVQKNADCFTTKYNQLYSCSIPFNLLHYPLLLNSPLPIDNEELDSLVHNVYNVQPEAVHSLILKSYYSLYLKKHEQAFEFAKEGFNKTNNLHVKGVALVFQIFSGCFEEKTIRDFEDLQSSYTQHPPYWFIANYIVSIKKGDYKSAYNYAQYFNAVPSRLSTTYNLLIKRKISTLSKEEERYMNENPSDFSEDFLSHFLSSILYHLI